MNADLFVIRSLLVVALFLNLTCSLDDIFSSTESVSGGDVLTEAEVISGLKEALSIGIDTAAVHLSAVGGYLLNESIRIALPEDVSTALDFVESLQNQISPFTTILSMAGIDPFNFSAFVGLRDTLMVSMNHAAEKAAPLSVDIFKAAIAGLRIKDGFDILEGHDTAATEYLKTKTYTSLIDAFEPFVDSMLALVGAQHLWRKTAANYNAVARFYKTIIELPQLQSGDLPILPFDSLSTDLALFTTKKALSGLYHSIGEQERLIRKDPVARVTEILQKVFGFLGIN